MARGLSQQELAHMADVDVRSIHSYEQRMNSKNRARVEILYHISKMLGCHIEDLMKL